MIHTYRKCLSFLKYLSSYEQILLIRDHFQNGFSESQRVIQFQDTKAWKILSFSTLIFGGTLALVRWIFEFETSNGQKLSHKLGQFNCFEIIVAVASLVFFATTLCLAISFCQQCIKPRKPLEKQGNSFHEDDTSKKQDSVLSQEDPKCLNFTSNILFPHYDPDCPKQLKHLQKHSEKFLSLKSSEKILIVIQKDYQHQSEQLGRILFKKIQMANNAVTALYWEIIASVLILMETFFFLVSRS